MSDWQNKSDFDINAAVTCFIHGCEKWDLNDAEFYHCGVDGSGYFSQPILDYCNNPSDAWPIIVDNKIDLTFAVESLGGIGQAQVYIEGDTDIFCEFTDNEKALRAAMIVYLEMNGVKP